MPNKAVKQIDQAIEGKDSRTFACPGLFRIVPSKDGGICRIKLGLGRLTATQARVIATTAQRLNAGAIEATNRANLQIRGIPSGAETQLIDALREADLGGADRGADDIRNVMVSPLAGSDPDQILDARPIADAILARLQTDARYHLLSPKFALLVDGGESVAMLAHPNDIWLSAVDSETFALGFAGCPPLSNTHDHTACFVKADQAEAVVFACLDLFLRHRGQENKAGQEITRFRHLLQDMSAAEILAATGMAIRRDAVTQDWRRRSTRDLAPIGVLLQRDGRCAIGALPPLGRLTPEELLAVANLAEQYANGEIRMTPWQSLILPNVSSALADDALAALAATGLVTDAATPSAGMITCAGNSGCNAGLADVKRDAQRLAVLLRDMKAPVFGLHLTGCAKSCAAPRPAQATLLATAPDRYDVFWREDGAASKFGSALGTDHDLETAARLLLRRHGQTQGQN